MTAIACGWLDDGTVSRLEEEKRQDAVVRQLIAGEVLAGLECVRHPTSYFLWLPLPKQVRADQVAAALGRAHILVSTAQPFATSVHLTHAIRLTIGSVELEALRKALYKVKRVISDYAC